MRPSGESLTAEEDMLDKCKQEREDRNNSYGGEELPDVEVAYVVMDASHSQTDNVGRNRSAKFCGSRDDSLSWNLNRVKQYVATRADDMDHKIGAVVEIEDWPDYEVHNVYSSNSEMFWGV